jgi:hypothetical protein
VVVDETRAIVPEFHEKHIKPVETDEFFKFYHKYDGMDLGVVDQTVCLFGYYDFRRAKAVIQSEIMMQGHEMTTDVLANNIRSQEVMLWGEQQPYRRIADSDNPLLIQDLARLHGLGFIATTKDTLEAMVNVVRMWFKEDRIEVDPSCKMLIGCLKTGIWDKKRRKFERSSVYGHYDALAALIYWIRNIDTTTNPIPSLHDLSDSTHHIPDQIRRGEQNDEETFRDLLTGRSRKRR